MGGRKIRVRRTPRWEPLAPAAALQRGVPIDLPGRTMWLNRLYTVIRMERATPWGGDPAVYLSIRRNDRSPARSWRDFQRIKNQLAGPEYEGVELYPAESRKVDGANQYHLFCFPVQFPFGFNDREVVDAADAAEQSPGAVQEPLEDVDLMYGGPTKDAPVPTLRWPWQAAQAAGGGRL